MTTRDPGAKVLALLVEELQRIRRLPPVERIIPLTALLDRASEWDAVGILSSARRQTVLTAVGELGTQRALAARLGKTEQTVSNWINRGWQRYRRRAAAEGTPAAGADHISLAAGRMLL